MSGFERRTLSLLSWLALAGSLSSASLAVQVWLGQEQPTGAVRAIAPADPSPAPLAAVSSDRAGGTARVRVPIRELRVLGIVCAEGGDPIAGARVRASQAQDQGISDLAGRYELAVRLHEDSRPVLSFSAPGYGSQDIALRPAQLALEAIQLDVILARVGSRTIVAGVLRSPSGEPVASETVQLRAVALKARHADVSDARGAFSMSGVRVGVYDFVVRPRGPYAEYWRRGVEISAEGLELEVVLEPLPTRRLTGRMVDTEGRPVPGFRLWLRGDDARKNSIELHSDEAGRFHVEGAPVGRLSFASSSPQHLMRGVARVEEGAPVDIVLDAGERRFEGRVLDPRGEPVAGAQLNLAWLHRGSGLQSRSVRRSVSDADGGFGFDGLGPGPHRLTVSLGKEGAPSRLVEVAAGARAVEIVLDPAGSR